MRINGYLTFLYRNSGTGEIVTNSANVGNFFRTANFHVVIDSVDARASWAIMQEVKALSAQREVPGVAAIWPGRRGNKTTDPGELCCQLCEVVDEIPVSCGPEECGPQCSNAEGAGSILLGRGLGAIDRYRLH